MNGLRKSFKEKSYPKNEKSKDQAMKLPHASKKKPPVRKRTFVQTAFSHSTSEWKKSSRCKTTRFLLHFLFRREKNHYSNLSSKIEKMCKQS